MAGHTALAHRLEVAHNPAQVAAAVCLSTGSEAMTPEERRQKVVGDYKGAYKYANGYEPKTIRYYGNGWFVVPLSSSKVRERELIEMTQNLLDRPAAKQ